MSVVQQPTDTSSLKDQLVHELRIALIPEKEGGFSAIARDLPGIASQGDTIEKAIENVREACAGALDHVRTNSVNIPWAIGHFEAPNHAKERWVLVDG